MAAAALFTTALAPGAIAQAQTTDLRAAISTEARYTDNVRFFLIKEDGYEIALIPSVIGSYNHDTTSLNVLFSGRAEYESFDKDIEIETGLVRIDATHSESLPDDRLVATARALISQELADSRDVLGRSFADDDNLDLVQRYNFNLKGREPIGSGFSLNASGDVGYSIVGGQGTQTIESRNSARLGASASLDYETGGRARLSFGGSYLVNDLDKATERTRASGAVQASYDLLDRVTAFGALGFDEVDDPRLAEDVSGPAWNAGLRWTPNGRLSLEASGGVRFERTNYGAQATLALSRRARLIAYARRSFGSRNERFFVDGGFGGGVGDGFGFGGVSPAPIPRPGGGVGGGGIDFFRDDVIGVNPVNDLREGVSFADQGGVTFSTTLRRTTYSLTGRVDRFDFVDIFQTGEEDLRYTGVLNVSRRIKPRVTAYASAFYQRSNLERGTFFTFGRPLEEDFLNASGTLQRRIGRAVMANISYTYRQRWSNDPLRGADENIVSFSLSRQFQLRGE